MVRPKAGAPALQVHISGRSRVTIGGKDYYLGPAGSAESFARYAALIRIYQEHQQTLPKGFTVESLDPYCEAILGASQAATVASVRDAEVTVEHVCEAFRKYATDQLYAKAPKELNRATLTLNELIRHYGKVPASEFGPLRLQEQRDRWVKRQFTRAYVNRLARQIVQFFQYAVEQEMIAETVWWRLKSVKGLRCGQTTAPEGIERKPVPLEHVRRTAQQLSPILKAMLRVHVSTGMRPTELCLMRPCDIDRTGKEWIYRPPSHKNKNKGKARAIPILGDAREAIEDYMNRPPDKYLFSPKESHAWFLAQKRSRRVTPDNQGNRPGTNRKPNPKKQIGDHYDHTSYRQSIERAAARAGVPRWTPYLIRHLTATSVRDALGGLEGVQAILGHSDQRTTQRYSKLAEERAIEAARAAPQLRLD